MPRLITLLLLLVSLALLAVQNQSTSLPLVILSSETPAIPVGLLLVGAVCIGALITVVLYGLVGLGKPPESKYRPMGQRVPYPESPGSTTLPPSGPASSPSTAPRGASSYTPSSTAYTGGSSSAFVSSPPSQNTTAPPTTPTDTPPNPPSTTPPSTSVKDSSFRSHFGANAPTPPVPQSGPSNQSSSPRDSSGPAAGAKDPSSSDPNSSNPSSSVKKKFKQLGRKLKETVSPDPDPGDRKVGEDWGELRPVTHRNSWDALEENTGRQPGLFDFMKPGSSTRESAGRIASDIAAGWSNQQRPPAPNQQPAGYDEGDRYPAGNRYANSGYANSDSGYDRASYDELDQGWENFDHYDSPPPPREGREGKRVYGDSLYGSDSRGEVYPEGGYPEGAYPEEGFLEADFPGDGFPEEDFVEDPPNEIGPDGVYEADYRVIEPPSKPLKDDDDDYVG